MPVYTKDYAEWVHYWLYRERVGELEFIDRFAQKTGGPVLELASGAARVTKELARRGHTVVGLEMSVAMLDKAREVLGKMPEKVRSRVHLVRGDMTKFSFARPFPLIVIPFYSFWHNLDETGADACVRCITANLMPGGTFLVEGEQAPEKQSIGAEHRAAFWRTVAPKYGFSFRYEEYRAESTVSQSEDSFLVGQLL